MFTYKIVAVLLFLTIGCSAGAQTSPYSIVVNQPNNTKLEIIGAGDGQNPYTETVDGYTLLKNTQKIYVYAQLKRDGILKPSKIEAHNVNERTKREVRFLRKLPKNLRNKRSLNKANETIYP